jgi:hypothetical protein
MQLRPIASTFDSSGPAQCGAGVDICVPCIQIPLPQSSGLRESVCKVKPDNHHNGEKAAKVNMDSNVHGDSSDSLTDTIQHLLYAEAQSEQSGDNGGNTSEVGEAIVESLHPQLPHLS